MQVICTLDVCAECYSASEYGVESVEDFEPGYVPLSDVFEYDNGNILGPGCNEHSYCGNEHGFKKERCEGCAIPYHGNRYPILVAYNS